MLHETQSQVRTINAAADVLHNLISTCRNEKVNIEHVEYALVLAVANSSGFCEKTTSLWNNTTTGWVLLAEICGEYVDHVKKDEHEGSFDDYETNGVTQLNADYTSATN